MECNQIWSCYEKTQVWVLVLKLAWRSPALGSRRTLPKIRDILFVAPTDQYSQPAVLMLLTSMKSISLNCPKSQMGNAASSANIYWPGHGYPAELCNSSVMKSPCTACEIAPAHHDAVKTGHHCYLLKIIETGSEPAVSKCLKLKRSSGDSQGLDFSSAAFAAPRSPCFCCLC